jgi:hypothetical protein
MGSASLFFDRLLKLPADACAQIATTAPDTDLWKQARAAVDSALKTGIPAARQEEVRQALGVARSSFDHQIGGVVADLGAAAIAGILVRDVPNLGGAARTLYQPFEAVMPYDEIDRQVASALGAATSGGMPVDPRTIDAKYKQFPSFGDWAQRAHVDVARWETYKARLPERGALDDETLRRAREVVARAAAVDTGAIEGLYEVDQGFTYSVAFETAVMESLLEAKGAHVRALIESQINAYQTVLDFATELRPIAEAFIRTLHAEITAEQDTYLAATSLGYQEQQLPKGEYKHHPNHVRTPNGGFFAYAPVDIVAPEMHRFVEELQSGAFQGAHPIVQAAYAHYAFVRIHPFADGNGRVARALASVFTYRARSIPVLFLADRRAEYLNALRAADADDPQAFVDFVLERTIDAIMLAVDSFAAAAGPQPETEIARLGRAYSTRGGYSHVEVDLAGYRVFDAFRTSLRVQADEAGKAAQLKVQMEDGRDAQHTIQGEVHRQPVAKGSRWTALVLESPAPGLAAVRRLLVLEVPADADRDDEIVVRALTDGATLAIRMTESHPELSTSAQIRVRVFAGSVLARALADLREAVQKTLKKAGY